MNAAGVVQELHAAGGSLRLVGGEVKATIPPQAAALLPQLREHKAAIIEMLSQSQAAVERLESEIRYWDNALLRWTRAECAFREHSYGSLQKLYENHIAWAHKTGAPFAPDVETFAAILMALGFKVSGPMVNGLLLKADVRAAIENGGARL